MGKKFLLLESKALVYIESCVKYLRCRSGHTMVFSAERC